MFLCFALRAFSQRPRAWHPMPGLAFALVALGVGTLTPQFASQTLAQNAASTGAGTISVPATAREVLDLLLHGNYDEAINKATKSLDGAGQNDPQILYFRGRAAYFLGHYSMARQDLSALGDYKPYASWQSAQLFVERIDAMKRILPANTIELRDEQGAVTFRVYYDEDNEWSRAVIKLLPEARRINQELLGRDAKETLVFIFNDPIRFEKFLLARNGGNTLVAWAWAFGGLDGLNLCQNKTGSPRNAQTDYLRGTVVHEFNHTMVQRISGGATLPPWFSEGLAKSVEPTLAPALRLGYEKRLQRAAQADALLPQQTMAKRASFDEAVEQLLAKTGQGDAYAQGWSMVTYFLSLVPREKLTPFLEEVRDSRDFSGALLKFTGLTPDLFYAQWRAQLAPPAG